MVKIWILRTKYYFDDITIKQKNLYNNIEFTIQLEDEYYHVKGLSSDERVRCINIIK